MIKKLSFACIFLFLETVRLLDLRALYTIQYNVVQYSTMQYTIQYAFLEI